MENYLREFDIILQDMISQMESSQVTCNLTKDFIRTMIPHHEAAIYMSSLCPSLCVISTSQK